MSPRESYSNRMSILLQGSEAVSHATDAAREFGGAQRLTEDELARLCIVIEELVTNLYDHGGVTEQDKVQLTLGSEPGALRVTIIDPGMSFDPWSAPLKRERPERGGGAGIDIVRSWAQLVDYKVTAEANRLELLLPLQLR